MLLLNEGCEINNFFAAFVKFFSSAIVKTCFI